jgi:hypothetical protein
MPVSQSARSEPPNGHASARISSGYSGKNARLLWPLSLQ